MNAITSFLSHYVTTYVLYLQSPIIWEALFLYAVVMTLTIALMAKANNFKYFVPVLGVSILSACAVNTYTFLSLW